MFLFVGWRVRMRSCWLEGEDAFLLAGSMVWMCSCWLAGE